MPCDIIALFAFQGRCTWFNPIQKAEDEFEDEEEDEEEKEQLEEPEPETGPSLLTSIEQDTREPKYLPSTYKEQSCTISYHVTDTVNITYCV